jgi:hypothetical protein
VSICAFCDQTACDGLTIIEACDAHWDNPEQAAGVLLECAGALANLMDDPTSERNIRLAEIALDRFRAMNYRPEPLDAAPAAEAQREGA